jgi:predicted flap endonuclease-1-like 5' DNA nuclease
VQIDGNVGGSITALSGDVDLGGDAFVGGDISVVSGEVDQQRGAVVKGSVLRGPSTALDLPDLPALAVPPPVQQPSLLELLWDLVGRIVLAVLLLGLAAGVGVLLVRVRPAWVENSRRVLVDRTALSFAAGLLFNLVGGALIALLWLSVCFRPPALLLALLFGAVNLVGLAALGDEIGLRANARLGLPRLFRPAIGILLPGIVVAFFWILGSCFGFFASLTALLVSALGTGAVLVSALKLSEPPAARAVGGPEVAAEPFSAADGPLSDRSESGVAQEAEAVQRSDNFTRINGIGIVFDQRLKAAGIVTFAQLARCTPAEIAKIVLWPEGRIRSSAIIEQAQALADEQG